VRSGDGTSLLRKTEVMGVPFRKFTASFTPAQLEVLTAAFHAAKEELIKAGVEVSESDLAQRILKCAGDGIFNVAELKRAALEGLR
jgi:hypothetical protein